MSTTEARTKPTGLFEFHDGIKQRRVDAWKAILAIRESLPLHAVQSFATQRADIAPLVAACRKALNVPEWDEATETGLTYAQMSELTAAFLDFVEGKKKAPALQPT
jgi:hypothetical protein